MSLKGNAAGRTVVGKINGLDLLTISAYGIAVKNGFEGTEEEWLASLKGDKGDPGYTPKKGVDYFDGEKGDKGETGDKGDRGEKGDKGDKGEDGYTPVRGVDYWTEDDKAIIMSEIAKSEDAPAIVCEKSGSVVSANDASDRLLKGLTIYGKTTQDGTPTPDNPVELVSAGASGAINTTVCGKNLIDEKGTTLYSGYFSDSTGVRVSGNSAYICFMITKLVNPNTTYTLSCNLAIKSIWFRDDPVENISKVTGGTGQTQLTFTTPDRCNRLLVSLYNTSGAADTVAFEWAQLEVGDTATAYEPYKGQTATFSTPNGLHGIGEVKDEIDGANGLRVQRVQQLAMSSLTSIWKCGESGDYVAFCGTIPSSENERKHTAFVSAITNILPVQRTSNDVQNATVQKNVFAFNITEAYKNYAYICIEKSLLPEVSADGIKTWLDSKNAVVLYLLETPIETPLSAEEMEQYIALRTYYPNTTVYNDGGAGMSIEYVADTKSYIDQKLAAISAAVLNA